MSNTLDQDQDQQNPDQDRHSVGADLGSNCLQRLSAEDKKCSVRSGRFLDLVKSCILYFISESVLVR